MRFHLEADTELVGIMMSHAEFDRLVEPLGFAAG
jgi:hypothetical protein